jgi:predicted nucleic acid-binding protein
MSPARRGSPAPRERRHPIGLRYTIDASVFVNAFNPHEEGHGASLQILAIIQERGDPVVVPALIVPEIAAAVARVNANAAAALEYALAAAALPHLTLVALTHTIARQAAELATAHKLRGADAVYLAVARRYGTTLVSRDHEQCARGSSVAMCQTPEEAIGNH